MLKGSYTGGRLGSEIIKGQTQNPNLYPVGYTKKTKSEAADDCHGDGDGDDGVEDGDDVDDEVAEDEDEDEDEERALGTAAAGRCSPLDVSTSICGSRWPRTGLLSPVSPNQKTGSVPSADWSSTATVKTAIGQPARVTHGYRLHQQHLRSIFAALLPGLARVRTSVRSASRTHAAINTYMNPQGRILEVRATAFLPSPTPPPPPSPPLYGGCLLHLLVVGRRLKGFEKSRRRTTAS